MDQMKHSIRRTINTLRVVYEISSKMFLLIILINLLKAVQPFVNMFFSQRIIDELTGGRDFSKLIYFALAAIVLNVIILFMNGILSKRALIEKVKFESLFGKKMSFHQMNLSYKNMESNKVRTLQRNIDQIKMSVGGVETIVNDIEVVSANLLNLIVAICSFISLFLLHNPKNSGTFLGGIGSLMILLFGTVVSVIISFKLQVKQNIKISKLNEQANEANGDAFAYMQLISDYHFGKDIRIYKLKEFLCDTFNGMWSGSTGYKLTKQMGREKAKIPCITAAFDGVLLLLIYLVVIIMATAGDISAGMVIVYIGSTQVFTKSTLGLANSLGEMIGHSELLNPFLDLLNLPEETCMADKVLPDCPYILAFENVSFRYPDEKEWTLIDVNLRINNHTRVAFVGKNGAGKSTAIKLLCRLYEPQKGRITLNGIDIKEIDLQWYRNLFSVVFQDFALLPFKIGDNIACSADYENEKVRKALISVGNKAWKIKYSEYEKKCLYKDYDGNGIEISGGEAQGIAIARALYKDAPFVILDEPTAALDPQTEAEVYTNFDKIARNKTAIYISHRLSSCRFCDEIVVFDKGHVIQSGKHEQLLCQSELYRSMWEAQSEFYTNT